MEVDPKRLVVRAPLVHPLAGLDWIVLCSGMDGSIYRALKDAESVVVRIVGQVLVIVRVEVDVAKHV